MEHDILDRALRQHLIPGTNPLKLLLVVGERENVFHWHPYVTVVPDGDAALAYLDTYHRVVGCCEL